MSAGTVESARRRWVAGPVGRKIMIHSGQIPALFLADKILEAAAGGVYRETQVKEGKKRKNIYTKEKGNGARVGFARGNRPGKVCRLLAES